MGQYADKLNELIAAGQQYLAARGTGQTPTLPVAGVRYQGRRLEIKHRPTGEWIPVQLIRRVKA